MYNTPLTFQVISHAIGGKLVTGKIIVSEEYKDEMDHNPAARNLVKTELIHQMAEYMMENKLVEFTYQDSYDGQRTILVRAYLAPDAQIKILRTTQ